MIKERNNSPRINRHLSIAPVVEPTERQEIVQEITFNSHEPEQPMQVALRLDRRAFNLLKVLADYDQTNPAEQIRTATTLYLNLRLGDQAVQDFMTERERHMQQVYDALYSNGAQNQTIEEEK